MAINSLGYLGVTSQDVDAWRSFGTDVLGLQDVSDVSNGGSGDVYLKMDEDPWRLFIEAGDTDQLCLCGWEVVSESALQQLSETLSESGTD